MESTATVAIYYFTGTGNCLAVARRVAAAMGCRPIPIADVINNQTIQTDATTIGIVFPTYLAALHGVPLIVERFISQLEHIESKRLFAICTCGGYEIVNAVPSLRNLGRFIRKKNARHVAEYTVRLPMNNLDYEHIPVPIETDSAVIIKDAEAQINDIWRRIIQRRRGKYHFTRRFFTFMMIPMYSIVAKSCLKSLRKLAAEPTDSQLGFRELMPLTDKSINVDDSSCTGCGICARVCPVNNIDLTDGKPVWQHRCEMCFACDEWCPQAAIHHWGRPNGAKYHHPEVTATDLFNKTNARSQDVERPIKERQER